MYQKKEKAALNGETIDQLMGQSNLDAPQKEKFLKDLEKQLSIDNHDISVDERMEIIETCFGKCITSVVMQIPDPNELHDYKMCIRKFTRVKMRSLQYYHGTLHAHEDYLYKNLRMFRPFLQSSTPDSNRQ